MSISSVNFSILFCGTQQRFEVTNYNCLLSGNQVMLTLRCEGRSLGIVVVGATTRAAVPGWLIACCAHKKDVTLDYNVTIIISMLR